MTDTQGRSRTTLGGSCRPSTETRSIAAMPVGAIRVSGRAGWPTGRPIRSCPPYGWTARSCARTSARRAHPSTKTLGRSRGGFSPQIHILTDRRGRPLRLYVTGGSRHGSTQSRTLVEDWTDAPLSCLIVDRAYDGNAFARGGRNGALRPFFRSGPGARTLTPRNGTSRATPSNGASAGSNAGGGHPAMTHTRSIAWIFCTWRRLGSGCHPASTRPHRSYGVVSVRTKATCGSFHAQSVRTRVFAGHPATERLADTGPDALAPRRQR